MCDTGLQDTTASTPQASPVAMGARAAGSAEEDAEREGPGNATLSGALGRAKYAALVAAIEAVPAMACPNWEYLRRRHPRVPPRTLLGLFSQEAQNRAIRTHHHHKAALASYCAQYRAGADVLDLCAAADCPPCLLMRRMLETMLGLGKQRVSDVLRDPRLLTSAGGVPSGTGPPAEPRVDKALLERLRVDVVRCCRADRSYSPASDMAKALAGLEHEAALYEALEGTGVAYWTEQQLRDRGMYKTPDALLQVPIAIRCPLTGRWHIVHWLDSKAGFGDDRSHAAALTGQYTTYLNRYGSGAVIYWAGFVAELAAGAEGEDPGGAGTGAVAEVLLLERFPTPKDVRLLTPTAAGQEGGAGSSDVQCV